MRQTIALLISVATLACTSAQQGDTGSAAAGSATTSTVELTLDRSSYSPGAAVIMRITSHASDTLGYNQCSSRAIERQQGENWVAVSEPGRMCTMELRLLYPNQRQNADTRIPRDLPAGTYRIVLTLGRQGTASPAVPANARTVRAVSPTFRVE